MRSSGKFGMSIMAIFLAFGCSPAKKSDSSSSSSSGAGSGTTPDASSSDPTTGSIAAPSADATLATMTADNYPDGFYTGYDGGADSFALLLPGFRAYTVADPSVAKISSVAVTISTATMNSLIAALQKINPNMTSDQITKQFSRQQTMYMLTPLKAGNTTLTAASSGHTGGGSFANGGGSAGGMPPAGGAGGGGGGGDPWTKGTSLTLLVTQYTPAQVAAGKARYATAHDADDPACASCHLTGKDGAPPHALGDINDIPDVAAEQWVTTGKLGTRVATIPHAWKFASQDEELGTIAYVRSLETNDPEQLIALQFAQRFGLTVNADGTFSASSTAATTTTPATGAASGT